MFLSAGEEWRGQRRILAPTFAPRAIRILAKHVAVAAGSLIAELMAAGTERIDLFPALRRLALEIIGSAMFSLEMKRHRTEMCQLILGYAAQLGPPILLDFMLPLGVPIPYDLRRRGFRRRWLDLIGQIIAERQREIDDRSQRDLFDLLVTGYGPSETRAEQLARISHTGFDFGATTG